ncbi:oleosin 16 kDa-like [Phoenix dactylifera]|uniref:Oleosin 16 kDa-like n=1 Tax=Phoenix dactylifera TaxID=42345 RepID=A0A8B7MTE1_PHODC|nr:oleosin 16 kDa-like [Phoenix dactylifera]
MAEQQQKEHQPTSHRVVKGVTAATIGGSLLLLSGLMMAGTVIGVTVVTPLLVIFSPVLVPAVVTVFLLVTGFVTSGGLGVAAISVLSWLYKYLTGKRLPGSEQLEQARAQLASKARDIKDHAQRRTEQAQSS